ncbi:hypothetical protein V6N11_083570 [Hibiscus sabdariffa]|uniref:Exostosin GT47 domain-containing protein n=2 Tax=Hibiscus sabdariffa TaxID=183260 RepID=A0ABR2ACC8_9ROSI
MSSETLMEKPTSGRCRCRTQSWYIVLISFLLWFTLYMIYLYSTSVTFSKRGYSFTLNNDTALLDSSGFVVRDEGSSRVGDFNVVDNVDDENDTDSKTEGKPVGELSEDEQVYQAIQALLVADQNEVEDVETEKNSGNGNGDVAGSKVVKNKDGDARIVKGKIKEDHATEQKKGSEIVAERKREDTAVDREKRKVDPATERKEAADHLEQLRGEYVKDRAAKGNGTANVSVRQREGNAEGQGKREDGAEDQEKRKEQLVAEQKVAADHLEQLRVEYVKDRVAKGKGTANVLEQQREDNAEVHEKRVHTAEDQGKRKDDTATKQKEAADHLEQLRGEYVKDRAAKVGGTSNVLERRRRDNATAEDHRKTGNTKQKDAAKVLGQQKEDNAEVHRVEKIPIVESQTKRTRQSRRETRNKPVKERRIEKAVVKPRRARARLDSCSGRYIYIHNLPRKFNQDLLETCRSLSFWTDMCECALNLGLGAPLPTDDKLYSRTGWFNTNQFLLEVIFHNRMKQYRCLTKDPSVASAIYVPYYAGLDVGRYLWDPDGFMRDYDAVNIVKWLASRPEWKRMWGRDHFLVAGRINWDFRRNPQNESDWGNELLNLNEARNMTTLVLESSPWNYNDFAIPYPTYFHPSRDSEVFQWQNRMRRLRRRVLFSFAGARRPGRHESIRNELIDQCLATRKRCRFLECDKTRKCHKPAYVLKLFQSSIFCLQPSGDSYTRRSIFDSIVAGCIPVFFHPGSAYVQYIWHFPKDFSKYSVFIPESDVKSGKANIERILQRISRERRASMREEVISMIPSVIYADPSSRLRQIEDAFDLAVKGVLDRIETVRTQMNEGKIVNYEFDEEESWKYFSRGKLGPHEWDAYFSRKIGKRAL